MKVKLIAPHTHAGKQLPIGAEIDVSDTERTWLETHGVIEPKTAAPAATTQN